MINHFLDLVLTALTQNATPTNRIVHSKINEKRLNRLCKKCCFVVGVFFFFFFFFFVLSGSCLFSGVILNR